MENKEFKCPYCEAKNPLDARYCLNCGKLLVPGESSVEKSENENLLENQDNQSGEDENQTQSHSTKASRGKWYKNKKVIIAIVAVLLVVGSASAWYFADKSRNSKLQATYEEQAKTAWSEIVKSSVPLKDTIGDIKDASDFDSVSSAVTGQSKTLGEKKLTAQEFDPPTNQKQSKTNFIDFAEKYQAYLDLLDKLTKDPEEVSADESAELKLKAEAASKAQDTFLQSITFTTEKIDAQVFNASKITDLISKFQNDEKAKAEAKKKEEEEQKKAADKAAAEVTVTGFMTAYVDRNVALQRTFLTSAASTEMSDETLTHVDTNINSWRIAETNTSGAKYIILVREYDQFTGGGDPYQVKKNFTVVKQGDKWLVDSIDMVY